VEGYTTLNFDVAVGSAACEASDVKWNLNTNSTFALAPKKTMKKKTLIE
jgi:hypothetical protein